MTGISPFEWLKDPAAMATASEVLAEMVERSPKVPG